MERHTLSIIQPCHAGCRSVRCSIKKHMLTVIGSKFQSYPALLSQTAVLVRESEAPPPLAPLAEPSAGLPASAVADSAAVQAPATMSMLSMDEEDASPEARQCTAALREGKRCALAVTISMSPFRVDL